MTSGQPNAMPPITSGDRPHAPPADDESVYYAGSPLLGGKPEKVIVLALAGILFLLSPLLYYFAMNHQFPPHVVTLALLLIGIILLIVPVFITKSIRYRISNYRIDFERGFFSKDISTLELWHVEDLSFHQSILDRILGIGTIRVLSHDDNMPDLRMRGIPDARKLFEELKQRIIAVKRQTGVLKLDSGI